MNDFKELAMLKFKNLKEMFAWRAKFAPRCVITGKNGHYVLEQIQIEVGP